MRVETARRLQRAEALSSVCVAASERIVHLRTPKEATVARVIESCMKMLGATDDKSLFALKETAGDSCATLSAPRHL